MWGLQLKLELWDSYHSSFSMFIAQVTNSLQSVSFSEETVPLSTPCLSPDGRFVLFTTKRQCHQFQQYNYMLHCYNLNRSSTKAASNYSVPTVRVHIGTVWFFKGNATFPLDPPYSDAWDNLQTWIHWGRINLMYDVLFSPCRLGAIFHSRQQYLLVMSIEKDPLQRANVPF